MINLHYEAPADTLAQTVSSFYRMDFEGEGFSELERADRAQFRFQLRGNGSYRFSDGHVVDSYPVTIIGPTTSAVTAVANGPITIVGWGLLPAGWASLMGNEAEKWIDDAFDARRIFGDAIMDVHTNLVAHCERTDQFSIAAAAAERIHEIGDTAPYEFTAKVDAWLLDGSDPDIDQLAQVTGLSARQLERTTKRYYGMPPKKLARKYRALRAAQILAHGDSLDDSELGLAFYDQSHLIREVKQFTGLTPTQLRSGASELTQMTMKGRRDLTGKVSGLISDS